MTADQTQPTLPLPPSAEPDGSRRRSPWPGIVAAVLVVALAVAAWFAAEAIARGIVERTIREQVITSLALPADQQIDVEVDGAVLPQLIAGSLADVRIASQDVSVDAFTGDVAVTLEGVPLRGGELTSGSATVSLDEDQLRTLLSTVDRFPADAVTFEGGDAVFSVDLTIFGASIPVSVALTPSAADGDLVLSPASLSVAGAQIDAATLRSRAGALADAIVTDWQVCVAQYLPAGATVTGVAVADGRLKVDLTLDPAIISDPALSENGSCD